MERALSSSSRGMRIASAEASGSSRLMRSILLLSQKDTFMEFRWRDKSGVPARSSITGSLRRCRRCQAVHKASAKCASIVCASSTAMTNAPFRALRSMTARRGSLGGSRRLIPPPGNLELLIAASQLGRTERLRAWLLLPSYSAGLISIRPIFRTSASRKVHSSKAVFPFPLGPYRIIAAPGGLPSAILWRLLRIRDCSRSRPARNGGSILWPGTNGFLRAPGGPFPWGPVSTPGS